MERARIHALAAFTEALLSSDKRVGLVKAVFECDNAFLKTAIAKGFQDLPFRAVHEPDGEVEDVQITEIQLDDVHQSRSATKSALFLSKLASTLVHTFSLMILRPRWWIRLRASMPLHRFSGTVTDKAEITGVAKVNMIEDWSDVDDITFLHFNEAEIAIEEVPPREPID